MLCADDMFVNEDLSKPENRINIAIFGLMPPDWFREWFLKELNLQSDAIVYPPRDAEGARPDLKVVAGDGRPLARLEVELGTNPGQAEDYRKRYSEPVKTVWGKRSDDGDLSLEEIAARLDCQKDLSPQTQVNVGYLSKLIREGLGGHSGSTGRAAVSDEMRDHQLVKGLSERLGDRLRFDLRSKPPRVGCLKADTTSTPDNQGFSLRVYSGVAQKRTVFILNISGRSGQKTVNFPSKAWLEKYLPDHHAQVEAYASLLDKMGLDIAASTGCNGGCLDLKTVLARLDELVSCARSLAEAPS